MQREVVSKIWTGLLPYSSSTSNKRISERHAGPIMMMTRQLAGYGRGSVPYYIEPNVDELPVPQGSWAAANAKQQSKYNRQLFFGLSFFGITLMTLMGSGLVTLNSSIPELPQEMRLRYGSAGDCSPSPTKCPPPPLPSQKICEPVAPPPKEC